MDFSALKFRELQAECKKYGLKASGKKDSLIESLKAFLAQGQPSGKVDDLTGDELAIINQTHHDMMINTLTATTNTNESTASDMENVPSGEYLM